MTMRSMMLRLRTSCSAPGMLWTEWGPSYSCQLRFWLWEDILVRVSSPRMSRLASPSSPRFSATPA